MAWIAGALVLFGFHLLQFHAHLVDDAFISLRYARHLASGDGLVFNPGQRVEGYTNFLWVLLAALGLRLGAEPLAVLRAASFVASVGLVFVTDRMSRLGRDGTSGTPLPAWLWLLPLPAFGYWACSTMETMAFAAVFAAAVWLRMKESSTRRWHGSQVAFLLLALIRPEGALCFALSFVIFGARDRWVDGRWPVRRALGDLALFVVGFGAYTFWRVAYFGSWFPNTLHARFTGVPELWRDGFLDLGHAAATYPVLALVALGAPWVFAGDALRRERSSVASTTLAIWLMVVGWIVYVVSVGGDFMPFERFFLPVLPLLAVLTTYALRESSVILRFGARRAASVTAVLLVVHVGASLVRTDTFQAFLFHRMTAVGERVGRLLGETFERGTWIAVNAAGAVAYASELPTIDMLGNTDPAIARSPASGMPSLRTGHRKGSGRYVMDRRPHVVFWYNTAGQIEPLYGSDFELARDPYFRFFYRMERASLPREGAGRHDRRLALFFGEPLGQDDVDQLVAPDLGVRFVVGSAPVPYTIAYEANVAVRYFVFREELDRLWTLRDPDGDLALFVREVAARWQREPIHVPPNEPQREFAAKALEGAQDQLRQGKRLSARVLLDVAAREIATLGSASLYEQMSELAFDLGDVPLAIEAQLQALRHDPHDARLAARLQHLLVAPWPS